MRSRFGMPFPWAYATVPHGLVDIVRGCNVVCPGCLTVRTLSIKPIRQIKEELAVMMKHRRLHTVTLFGGEPTLHPDLVEIVRYISSKRLRSAVLTNGVLIERALIKDLKRAGLDLIYLHIQSGQERPDSAAGSGPDELRNLRREKAELIVGEGLEAALSVIAYKSRLEELSDIVGEVLDSPHIHYLLVTEYEDATQFGGMMGDVQSGIWAQLNRSPAWGELEGEEVVNEDIVRMMEERDFSPFAFLGSSADANDPRWLLYWAGVVREASGRVHATGLTSALSDRFLIRLPYWLSGRYTASHSLSPVTFRVQLLLNALSGGRFLANLRLLIKSLRLGTQLLRKRFLFQQGPSLGENGEIVFCRDCPDAVVLNERLVPGCVADQFN